MSVTFTGSPLYSQEPTPVIRAEASLNRQPQGQHSGHVYPEGTGSPFVGYTPETQGKEVREQSHTARYVHWNPEHQNKIAAERAAKEAEEAKGKK